MKRTLSVTLGGRVFTMEYDAWAELDRYFSHLRHRFSHLDDVDTMIGDMESRIAEYFWKWRGENKQAVTLDDVFRIQKIMGHSKDPNWGDDVPHTNTAGSVAPARGDKRFYRDPRTQVIGGICGGLALYWGLDGALIRVLAIICLFLAGLSFWVYIVLWIVIPAATTDAKQLELRGYAVTPENVQRFRNGTL